MSFMRTKTMDGPEGEKRTLSDAPSIPGVDTTRGFGAGSVKVVNGI
jgi:hypothetical protein